MLRSIATVVAYMVAVFPLAYVWHLVLFKERFEAMGYLGRAEPIVGLGFAAIALQGVILALFVEVTGAAGWKALATVCVLFVATIWTAQVLAHAAKFDVAIGPFLALETGYFILQAAVVAILVAAVRSMLA